MQESLPDPELSIGISPLSCFQIARINRRGCCWRMLRRGSCTLKKQCSYDSRKNDCENYGERGNNNDVVEAHAFV